MTTKRLVTAGATAMLWGVVGTSQMAVADICYVDDLIVDGSMCVGFDCVCNMSFGFDTIVLKENNLRVLFDDTSVSASFPRNDWRLIANDSSNGGAEYFAIEDATAGRQIFRVEAGAPSNSLYVDDGGRVGLSTSQPVVDLHIVSGNTPTLRLEQDGSSGFAPQTWDVAGNETNFFVRDASNGSQLPFKIFPTAPTNSITIEGSTGDVGIGISSPTANLHVQSNDQDALLVAGNGTKLAIFESSDNNAVQLRLRTNSTNRRIIAMDSGSTIKSQIEFRDNDVRIAGINTSAANRWATISASGIVTQGPTCNPGPCDGVFRPEIYQVESIDEHAAYMWKNKHLWAVGATSPDKPFNLTEKTAGILHELEKAHIYIEQLHNRLKVVEKATVH